MAEGQRKTPSGRPNYVYVILSVALVLLLLGFFGLAVIQTQNVVDFFKEQVNIMVELKDNVEAADREQLETELRTKNFVKAPTLEYVSKEDGIEMLKESFGDDFIGSDLANPLFDILKFNVQANFVHQDSLSSMRQQLMEKPLVRDVYYEESMVNDVARNIERYGYLALAISIVFVFVAVFLIHNTIRLALYANRFLIKNMQLVGASWGFISKPYLVRSGVHGLLSALIAMAGLTLLIFGLDTQFEEINIIQDTWKLIFLFIALILLGILINVLSTYYVVNKYLKMRVDDLY